MKKLIICIIFFTIFYNLLSDELIEKPENSFLSMSLGYYYQDGFRHYGSWNVITESNFHSNIFLEYNIIPVFWTYRDRFLNKDEFSDNVTVGLQILLTPIEWLIRLALKKKVSDFPYLFVLNSSYYYFPILQNDNTKSFYAFGFYIQNNSAPYIFKRNRWISYIPGAGLSLIAKGIKLNIGYNIHHETNFNKTYKIPSWNFSIEMLGLEKI